MPRLSRRLQRKLSRLRRRLTEAAPALQARHARDPVGYVRAVLGRSLWATQERIARLLLEPPYKVLVKSCHSVGKTFLAAALTSWWYDSFDPGCVLTTAPTHRDVCDLLWREVRLQRQRAGLGGFVGPAAPELRSAPDHYAKGFTASRGESFQGRHQERMLFVFDEAVGVDGVFWETTRSMFDGGGRHAWLCLFNPTDTSSQAYAEECSKGPDGQPGWHVVTMSALEHPNLAAALAGQAPPFPGAVSLAQFEDWVSAWCDPIGPDEACGNDFEWPPGSGCWYRPGPQMEARGLGRWPSAGTYGVWSEALWQHVLGRLHDLDLNWPLQLGCDVARFGDDWTSIHVRRGCCALHHERHNGWSTAQTATRLRLLARQFARPGEDPRRVPVLVDANGLGAGVLDQADGHRFVGIDAGGAARDDRRHANTRSELWFDAAELARNGLVDLSRLPQGLRTDLGRQLLAPTYGLDVAGRLVVEPKDRTKARLGQSPDDADAFNLAWRVEPPGGEHVAGVIR